MGPALAPVFPPNNSAESTHLNSISTPRVMLLATGEKVWESQDLSFMSIQLRAFSDPQCCFHFRFSNSTFKCPTDSPFYSWHFLPFLFGSATSSTSLSAQTSCPLLTYFWVKDLFSLFTKPLSAWMSLSLIPQQDTCKFHVLTFLPNAGQSQILKERPGDSSWVAVSSSRTLWPHLRASPMTAPTPSLSRP